MLCLTDAENGDAIYVDDVYTGLPEEIEENTARLFRLRKIIAGAGDDIVDMPPMRRAGFPVAVADASPELDSVAVLRTRHSGGRGAVREAIEILLKGQGKWDSVLEKYML